MTQTAPTLEPLDYRSPEPANSAKWLVLLAAFLGWMFDGLEMGIFPQIAKASLSQLVPGADEKTIMWFGCKTANNKVVLCERAIGQAVILDAPDAEPRVVRCPYHGDYGAALPVSEPLSPAREPVPALQGR